LRQLELGCQLANAGLGPALAKFSYRLVNNLTAVVDSLARTLWIGRSRLCVSEGMAALA